MPSEWKGLGFVVISELSNSTLSAVNGAIDIAKAVPNVVSDISRAVGNLGTFGSAPMDTPPRSDIKDQKVNPAAFPDANDPAYEKAYEINGLTSTLSEIITRSLDQGFQQCTREELHKSLLAVQSCRLSLEDEKHRSGPSRTASFILDDCEKVCGVPGLKSACTDICRSSRLFWTIKQELPASMTRNGSSSGPDGPQLLGMLPTRQRGSRSRRIHSQVEHMARCGGPVPQEYKCLI